MIWCYILAAVACICSIIGLIIRNCKYNSIPVTLSAVALIVAFVSVGLAAPRNTGTCNLPVDYLGIIVAILAAFATLLLAMQLYNVFSVKEDAQKVEEAKIVIKEYAMRVSVLENKIKELEVKAEKAISIDDCVIENS